MQSLTEQSRQVINLEISDAFDGFIRLRELGSIDEKPVLNEEQLQEIDSLAALRVQPPIRTDPCSSNSCESTSRSECAGAPLSAILPKWPLPVCAQAVAPMLRGISAESWEGVESFSGDDISVADLGWSRETTPSDISGLLASRQTQREKVQLECSPVVGRASTTSGTFLPASAPADVSTISVTIFSL